MTVRAVPQELMIPQQTTSIEVWFMNSSGAGSTCQAYDSQSGANYVVPVATRSPTKPRWVGNEGSSFSRLCQRQDGVPDVLNLDSYILSRACSFVDLEVYVPGVTDGSEERPMLVFAQTELTLDGVSLAPQWMQYVGRFGNNYRYRFELPRSTLYYGPKWSSLTYTSRFSTDGVNMLREKTRVVTRDVSSAIEAWAIVT